MVQHEGRERRKKKEDIPGTLAPGRRTSRSTSWPRCSCSSRIAARLGGRTWARRCSPLSLWVLAVRVSWGRASGVGISFCVFGFLVLCFLGLVVLILGLEGVEGNGYV
jgi:hypothetical protein